MTKNGGVASYTEYFCYVLSGKLTSEDGNYLFNAVLGWDTESWIKLAPGKELIYGYYSDEQLGAEFVHVREGKCIRDYRVYDAEVETNEGETPEFDSWVDVATYVDKYLL